MNKEDKKFLNKVRSMAERDVNVKVQWNAYDMLYILDATRHKRYVELIVCDGDGEAHYLKLTNKEFVNLIIDGDNWKSLKDLLIT